MWIPRLKEKKIVDLLKQFPAVAVIGPRQIGKTSLVNRLRKTLKKKSIAIDLELPTDLKLLENPEIYFKQHEEYVVIIDEIQRMPELFPMMRALIDRNRTNGRFLILGSSSPDLIRRSSETLTGRIVYQELTGINAIEAKKEIPLIKHWMRGGFPMPLVHLVGEQISNWFSAFIRSILETDLPNLGLKGSYPSLHRFFRMIASQQGGILNMSSYADALGKDWRVINQYFDYFENGFLIRRLMPWYTKVKKRIVKSPKIYIRDSGILHYLLGIHSFDALLSNYLYTFSWEGFVIEQIISSTENAYQYYFYRTQDGTECDLVIVENGKPFIAIEVKSSEKSRVTRSFKNSIKDLGTRHNFIITLQEQGPYLVDPEEKIYIANLHDFCIDFLPKMMKKKKDHQWE